MNRQRKVVITITYNEMGIIIDTKAKEVAQPEIIRCKDCRYYIPQDERCRLWCQFVDQSEWCSRAKRKDGESDGQR